MFEVISLSFAFFFGLAARQIGLPPLVGFLAAGFAINAAAPRIGLPSEAGPILEQLSHLGVLLLLFSVGLKLRLGQLAQPQVFGGALIHSAVSTAVASLGFVTFLALDWPTALLLGVVLSFSSTVFSAKMLDAKRDIGAFYGRTAIGILVVQDIIALVVLALYSGQAPSPWALVVLALLPLLRPVLHWLLTVSGHDELIVLAGMLLAVGAGGVGFQAIGLGSEIGALVMGLLLSTHPRAKELSDALWGLKEIFLVGFFLQIGMSGLPGLTDLLLALGLVLLLPLKGALTFALLLLFRLRARTAFLAAANLTTYSEFGLIVSAAVLPDWLVPLALAVSLSFIVAAPLDRLADRLFEHLEPWLQGFEARRVHRDELPTDLGAASVLILGMGRTGTAAYDEITGHFAVTGIDADTYRVAGHVAAGRNVLFADVEDAGFWRGLRMSRVEGVILAMDNVAAKVSAARALRTKGFSGPIIAHALYEDHVLRLKTAGATHIYQTMNQAGIGLAEQTERAIQLDRQPADFIEV
ncbi:MAG: cation:proton antiporter family protein [Tabrizicola sp.]|uniref:cation:proton antiporter domain-containing protein n=1 Tax=Tabrizicola sp. TaxID=2005166 RepID=UPI001B763FE8|nr:cation:proton antiporter [Tabrizicola sp.]